MKILVIGAVAAGTSAAAKARRNSEDAEIKIYEMDSDISYSGCGLPYYISDFIKSRKEIAPRDAKYFKDRYNVDIYTRHRVDAIDPEGKTLTVTDLDGGKVFTDTFDRLIIATGARPIVPKIEGSDAENVFFLRNVQDADRIKSFIENKKPKTAAIIGAGFIGLEMAESLTSLGIKVTLIDLADQVMPPMDSDMAVIIKNHLTEKGVSVKLGTSSAKISSGRLTLSDGNSIDADFVILSVGVRPNVELAKASGIAIGKTGAIKVNTKMQTNFDYIYSCGDCAEAYSVLSEEPIYRPLGSTANKMGRVAGDQATGGTLEFGGILGTGIFRVFDLTAAMTGLTEKEARKENINYAVCHNIKPDKPEYFGGRDMTIKAIADKETGFLLGVQIVGPQGVDKRIDVFVTAMTYGATVDDLFHLDLAYAPPYSTTKDPVMYTGMILDNMINRGRKLITPYEVKKNSDGQMNVLDVRAKDQFDAGHIEGAVSFPQEESRERSSELDKEKDTVVYCNKGVTGNAVQNMLINKGFKTVYNLSGGYRNYKNQE